MQTDTIPQVVHLLIPDPLIYDRVDRLLWSRENKRDTDLKLYQAGTAVYNKGVKQYFTFDGYSSTKYAEEYIELYQMALAGDLQAPLWGTRLYRTGAVVRKSVVPSYLIGGEMWLSWFQKELRGTMIFAAELYRIFSINAERIRVIAVLRGAEKVPLNVPGPFGSPIARTPKDIQYLTIIPRREKITVQASDLYTDPHSVVDEMSRLLELRYG